MNSLGAGANRLLGRLAINPAIRQAHLAKELQVTRSAVNQLWKRLERVNNLKILSNLNYGLLGFQSVFGWASTTSDRESLSSFENWITTNTYSTVVLNSLMTSKMDNRLFFEGLVPSGKELGQFLDTLERYRKKPYSLDITYDFASSIANHLNFGYFDGQSWNFDSGFRFEATIDAAKSYADILPVVHAKTQSPPQRPSLDQLIMAAALETNYFCTSSDVRGLFIRFGSEKPSERTLRRKLHVFRKTIAQPYLSIDRIGLIQKIVITLEDTEDSSIYKILRAQSASFPKARVLSGPDCIGLVLDIPKQTDWLHISNIIANIAGSQTETCTFIAQQVQERIWLETILQKMKWQE